MASLVRGCLVLPKLRKAIIPVSTRLRYISTSKKNSEVQIPTISELAKTEKDFSKPETDTWLSYGYDIEDKELDRSVNTITFFLLVTCTLTVGCFYYAYMPDASLRSWAAREAYLELRHREEQGLPLIDPNLIDPSLIILPTEEELGDTEIII